MPKDPVHLQVDEIEEPVRPSYRQEVIRQWILLLPLVTAMLGSALIRNAPFDDISEFLPSFFFLGALLVTAAMLHQRHTYEIMLKLAERAHVAYNRLDTLHGLAQELNKPLNTIQVAETVLEYSLHFLEADEGCFWLRKDFLPGSSNVSKKDDGTPESSTSPQPSGSWRRIVDRGFAAPERIQVLDSWEAILEQDQGQHEISTYRIQQDGHDSPDLSRILSKQDSAVSLPIIWEEQCIGIMLINNLNRRVRRDEVTFLTDIRLATGPALQNALQFQAATERAEIDGLTRLYNHRAIRERLIQEVARVARERRHNPDARVSVAMMDLTDFKLFNDSYGHAVGDQVLRSVGECMRRIFRISDLAGRYGGDEFMAILPDTDLKGAQILCSRIIETLKNTNLTTADGLPINIRLACGVAAFPVDGDNAEELLAIADERLYAAKELGILLLEDGVSLQQMQSSMPKPDWRSIGLIETIVNAIDQKDHYTKQHCEKVWHYASLLTAQLNLSGEMQEATKICSLLFDVGKIVLPHELLRKPGRLTPDEQMVLQQHPVFGALIVRDVPHLENVLGGVRHHHESFDGSGYPDQLRGEEIPLLARVLTVADSFSAMTTERPYHPRLSHEQAMEEIARGRGKQFDPNIVDAFIIVMQEQHNLDGPSRTLRDKDIQNNVVSGMSRSNTLSPAPVARN